MKSILIIAAFIIAIALLFWLDRKSKNEKSEAERIYDEIFKIFNRVRWDMTLGELREIFSEKDFVTSEEAGEVMGTGYMDKLDGWDIFISFYFPKEGEERLVRTDFYLLGMPTNKFNLILSKFSEKYGPPFVQDSTEEKSSLWDLGNSILTVEATEEQELQIQLWSKEFYSKISRGV